MSELIIEQANGEFLAGIKTSIREARLRAGRAVNRELIALYWRIGEEIVERQERHGWGKSVVEQLATDLRLEFPGTGGFSVQNLRYMRQVFFEYRATPNFQKLVGEIQLPRELAGKLPEARELEGGILREMGEGVI